MEDLGSERNTWFPWSNINHHQHQQEIEQSFIFGSENIFFNPIQDLRNTNSTVCLNPITAAASRQMGSHQLAPARIDSINAASSVGQHWGQTLTSNGFREGKNVIPTTNITAAATVSSLESLDCLLSATNSNAHMSSDPDDGISVIFPDYNNLRNNIINNLNGVSSADSVTKEIDDGEDNQPRSKKRRSDPDRSTSSTINFRQGTESDETDSVAIAQMKKMIYRAAAFRPVSFSDEEVVEKRRRKNVKISSDPQTVAARQRREKISERIRVLQKLVPGGNKMDTASMLDEAANYLKFLRTQVKALEQFGQRIDYVGCGTTTNANSTSQMIQNIDPTNVTLGVPFPMQTHFLLPHQQLYPTPPPA